jgi:mono/diheme cytochrome c family protein
MKGIGVGRMFRSIKYGRPGTAMNAFQNVLTDREIEAVIAYIQGVLARRPGGDSAYHSRENRWEGFASKYPEAIRYFLYEGDDGTLSRDLMIGKSVYESSCVTCHLVKKKRDRTYFKPFRK